MGTSCMVYMSEMAMPQFRGALLAAFSMAFALGQVFLAVGLKTLEETAPMQFRRMFYSEFVFTGLWLIPMLYIPESPGMSAYTTRLWVLTLSCSMVLYQWKTRSGQESPSPINWQCRGIRCRLRVLRFAVRDRQVPRARGGFRYVGLARYVHQNEHQEVHHCHTAFYLPERRRCSAHVRIYRLFLSARRRQGSLPRQPHQTAFACDWDPNILLHRR
jgi:hypothetical protein